MNIAIYNFDLFSINVQYSFTSFNLFFNSCRAQNKSVDCYLRPQGQDESNTLRIESNILRIESNNKNILENITCTIKTKQNIQSKYLLRNKKQTIKKISSHKFLKQKQKITITVKR